MISDGLKKMTVMAGLGLVLTGCMTTTYSQADPSAGSSLPFAREVFYRVSDTYYQDLPECVTVMPAGGVNNPKISDMVELAAAGHLSQRLDRVIGPAERRYLVRKLVVDLKSNFDRNHYLAATGCKHFAVPSVKTIDNTFVVFWSQMDVELQLTIERAQDGFRLWYGRHKAHRGDGGLPLSPLGLGSAAISAGWMQGDGDRLPSMIDDAMRRIVMTIPNTRQFSAGPRRRFGADRPVPGNVPNTRR